MKKDSRIEKIGANFVKIIFLSIMIGLLICSMFSTADMKKDEHTFYNTDNPIIHIVCILAICFILIGIKLKGKKIKITKKKLIILIIIWTIICTTWIFITQLKPRADQKYVLDAARTDERRRFFFFR